MKKLLLPALLGLFMQGVFAQSYQMRVYQPGLTQLPLSVASVSPSTGPYGAATQFTITGDNFDDTLVVEVGDVVATCGVPTKTTIACVSPLQPDDGSYPVVVRREDGAQDASKSFTYEPTGPTGMLTQIASAQVYALTRNASDELLYLVDRTVYKISNTGAARGTVFSGPGWGNFGTPSGCKAAQTPNFYSLAVDAGGTLFLGGNCLNNNSQRSAAVWKMTSSSMAAAHTAAWGDNNKVEALVSAGNMLYAQFATLNGTATYHATITNANGAKTNLPADGYESSNVVYLGAPYIVNTAGRLARYVSGSSWTVVGPALAGAPGNSRLAAGPDGFLYYLPYAGTVLHKVDPATGVAVKSWPLSGLVGSLTGLVVNSQGSPFIATYSGVWRMD